MLLDGGLLGDGQVTILQPRRLATRMLAGWVAQARNVKLGGEVGYQMRLDNVTSAATRICYVTEGVLLRQMLADPRIETASARWSSTNFTSAISTATSRWRARCKSRSRRGPIF